MSLSVTSFDACDLHFPHKDWSGDTQEFQNYEAIEQWAYRLRTATPCFGMTDTQFSPCDLHIPHKNWSGDDRERQNYSEMERWANYFRRNCCPGGGADGGGAPESPPLLIIQNKIPGFGYCQSLLGMPVLLEDNAVFLVDDSTFIMPGAGITYDTPLGGNPVIPYAYNSTYFGYPCRFTFPPCTNVRAHLKFEFIEQTTVGTPAGDEPVSRLLHFWIHTGPLGAPTGDVAHVYGNYMGTRASTPAQLDCGPYDIDDTFTIHSYCLWNSVNYSGSGSANVVNEVEDGLTVTGDMT